MDVVGKGDLMPGIVLESKRLVYWPIPKNASTSIKWALAKMMGISPPVNGVIHDAPFTWTRDPISGYRDIALVRHPLHRLFSLWANKIKEGHPVGPGYVDGLDQAVFGRWRDRFRSGMPFEEFVQSIFSIAPAEADPHWAIQSSQVPKGAVIYRMDREADDYLLRLLLPIENISSPSVGDWRKAFPPDLYRSVSSYYWEDLERFGYCRTILIDLDGVLTDGRFHMDHAGEKLFKSYHTRDIRAIRELTANGWEVVIVSADDWPGVFAFAEKVGAVVEIARDKSVLLERYRDFIAIGDDVWDAPLLRAASKAFVPMDADPAISGMSGVQVLDVKGGAGVVARVLSEIMKA